MSSITRWVLAHKRTVVVSWLVLTVVGVGAAGPASDALKQKFSIPGKEGYETNVAINAKYGNGGDYAPLVPVVTLPADTTVDSPGVRAKLAEVDARLERSLPGSRVASFASTGERTFVSNDGRTAFAVAYPPPDPSQAFDQNPEAAKKARAALGGMAIDGARVHLSGFDALQNESGESSDGPGVLLEAVLGGIGALCVLIFVFASVMALVPIATAIVSIFTTFLLLWGLTTFTDISPIVQFLVALVGLGVAIDYSLLIVVRWREERAHGHAGDEAVQRAMETAGRSVVFSGTTVAIGLMALIAMPIPFVRSMGYGGMLIPLVSTLVAITLLPVILAKLGPRLDWPHKRSDERASRAWMGWAEAVVRHRWVAAGVSIALLGALVLAATNIELGTSNADTIAQQGDAKAGLEQLEASGIGAGALLPHEVLVSGANPEGVAAALRDVEGVHGAIAPDSPSWRRGGTAVVDAFQVADGSSPEGQATLDRVRDAADAQGRGVAVGGGLAQADDFTAAVYDNFPLMIGLIAAVSLVLLARAFRSLLLPVKAVLLNVLSVGAAWGVLTLVWQEGHLSEAIWGIEATGSIPSWMPLMVFAFLFGLSMDYEVFILARMREEFDATGSTRTAVVRGIGRTGRLVTSAALILFLAFVSMGSGPGTDLKMFATGLAAGILFDATIIRAMLVPAVVSLFGRWNWVLPHRPARLLRVEPSLPPRPATSEVEG